MYFDSVLMMLLKKSFSAEYSEKVENVVSRKAGLSDHRQFIFSAFDESEYE
jgi:hypothetical protein